MKFPKLLLVFLALLVLADAQLVQAQTFAVKGVLRDPLGRTVEDGSYKLTLRLYEQATGGTEVFSEVHGSVPVQHGVFSAELGSVETLASVSFLNTLWLGIQVENENEMAPRIKLTPTPYSLGVLGTSNRFPSSGNVGIGLIAPQNMLGVEGNAAIGANYAGNVAGPADGLIVEGRVGIGTAIPGEPLDVNGNIKVNGALIFSDNTSISSASLSGSASSVTNPSSALITADSDEDGSGQIEFKTGAATRVTIKNTGIPLTIENAGETGLHINDTASGQSWQAGVNDRGFFLYDTAHRFVVNPGGNVGIGTPNPGSRLEVVGGISRFDGTGTTSGVFTGGNVGIGVVNPGWPLHVQRNTSGRPQVMAIENVSGNVGDGASMIFIANNGGNGTGGIGSVITNTSPFKADVRISTISGGSWQNDVLSVTGDRTVGINAPVPTADVGGVKLRVSGGGHVIVDNNWGFFSVKNGGGGLGAGIDTDGDDDLALWAGSGERMRIEAGGNVGIGTNDPDATLDVEGTVRMFGSWTTSGLTVGTNYQASTDLFVLAWNDVDGNDRARLNGYTDSNSNPTTLVARDASAYNGGTGVHAYIMMPVRKGDYWRIERPDNNGSYRISTLPLGR